MPPQIPFIIGNEACERFSFYGMRNILTVFLIDWLLRNDLPGQSQREASAKAVFHLFVFGVYFTPLLGGFLADRFLGKYRTVLYISLLYCAGHACLAIFHGDPKGFYAGLVLIALGSGGIKPCVSALVGDQFTAENKHLVNKVFAIFYWSINLGSFFASMLIPKTLRLFGPAVAFGIPGILMGIATVIFWLGRNQYVRVPPTGKNPHSFLAVVRSALRNRARAGSLLDGARAEHPQEAVEGVKAVFRVLSIFAFIPFFWMLFDQKASTWVVQARSMDLRVGSWNFEPSQMQLVNPALVMLLIPVTTGIVYPFFKRLGWELTPLRRMPIGMALGATSFVIAGLLNVPVASGQKISVVWQVLPYVVLTIGEILVSVTGLEFAYTQAPLTMKSVIQSFWNLTTAAANLAVALASAFVFFSGTALFFYYAGFAYLAAAGLALVARRYKVVDWYQRAPAPQPVQREAPLAEPA
ncbi:MAG TPA: POT family MFS transporter [Myxococcales bacterium]|nr:POT family MFS transporter [Myxococcales bacterium]